MRNLSGRVAVVTGAQQGIGAAIARRLAADGATVVGLDLDPAGIEVIARAADGTGGSLSGLACDVTSRDQVEQSMAAINAEHGSLDILVNNAGVTRDNLLHKMSEDDFDIVVAVHLKGTFLCSKEAQKYMVPRRSGKMIMLTSGAADGSRGQTNYAAAKAGIRGITKTLAIELGPFGITVNAISPGHTETPMTRGAAERMGISYDAMKEATIKGNAIKRVGQPEDIANAASFLVSDDADFITGQVLAVRGKP